MDKERLREYALALAAILRKYDADPEAAALEQDLSDLLDRAINREIGKPCRWEEIPGTHSFDQGNLRKYRDLESAFSSFAIEVSGERDDEITAIIRNLRNGS